MMVQAGFTNSNVTLGVYSLVDRTTVWANLADPTNYIIEGSRLLRSPLQV